MNKKNLFKIIGVGLGGLAIGILIGMGIGGSGKKTQDFVAMREQLGQGGGGQTAQRRSQFGGGASGEILNLDDKSITVKMRDGGSRIIFYASSTPVYKSVAGNITDLKIGAQISAFGSSGSDGSIVAESIQLRDGLDMPRISR